MKIAHSGQTVARSLWVPIDKNVHHFRVGQRPLLPLTLDDLQADKAISNIIAKAAPLYQPVLGVFYTVEG